MNTRKLCVALALSLAIPVAASAASADQAFVTKASQGGLAEVKLGEMAGSMGASDSVKTFAQHMVDDHGKANDELKTVATSQGATVSSEPSAKQKAVAAKLETMQGAAFDKQYAKVMVKDHQDTIALFKKESSSGKDPELKAFATKTLPTLEKHLQMAQKLEPGSMKAM